MVLPLSRSVCPFFLGLECKSMAFPSPSEPDLEKLYLFPQEGMGRASNHFFLRILRFRSQKRRDPPLKVQLLVESSGDGWEPRELDILGISSSLPPRRAMELVPSSLELSKPAPHSCSTCTQGLGRKKITSSSREDRIRVLDFFL